MKLAVIDTNVIVAAQLTKHDDSSTRQPNSPHCLAKNVTCRGNPNLSFRQGSCFNVANVEMLPIANVDIQ